MIRNRQLSLYLESPSLPEEVTLKQAGPEDAEGIFREAEKVIDTYEDFSHVDRTRALEWTRQNISMYISEYSRILYKNEHAGYIGSHIEDRKLYIDDLYLFPPFQNKGIGTYLIRQLIEQTNLDVVLHVFRNNTGAFALYRRLGFEIEAEYDRSRYLMIYRQIPEDDDFGE